MTVAKKRRKKLTNAQKNMNKTVKKRLQDEGILPPDKKRLNRKKFALEVLEVIQSDSFSAYKSLPYILKGISYMLPYHDKGKIFGTVTPEQIGILKALKIAIELETFWQEKITEGVTEVTVGELFETVVKPIIDL